MTHPGKILIIDDDARNVFALQAVLRAKGYSCLTAAKAEDGIHLLRTHPDEIVVVLMDMMMPEMDGYAALSLIKKEEKISRVPVIAVTAQAMAGDRQKCIEAGADDYISKPINLDQLILLLMKHTGKNNV